MVSIAARISSLEYISDSTSCVFTSEILPPHALIANKNKNYGFDALKNEYGDMLEKGILDPTKVTRSALQNAASVASTLLTTESIVADLPEENAKPQMPQDMGGMY